MSKCILIVEDDSAIMEGIVEYFAEKGCRMLTASTKEEALFLCEEPAFDLAILDIRLGEGDAHYDDGFEVCDYLHRRYPHLPVIILSARDSERSIDRGYELGCHEYVPKPCKPWLLYRKAMAKIQLAGREMRQESTIALHGIFMDNENHICKIDGWEVHLTPISFKLLYYLMINAGRVVNHKQLFGLVYDSYTDSDPRNVINWMKRLRDSIGEKAVFIESIASKGYRFKEGDAL